MCESRAVEACVTRSESTAALGDDAPGVVMWYRRLSCQPPWPRSATTWPAMAASVRASSMTASPTPPSSRAAPQAPSSTPQTCAYTPTTQHGCLVQVPCTASTADQSWCTALQADTRLYTSIVLIVDSLSLVKPGRRAQVAIEHAAGMIISHHRLFAQHSTYGGANGDMLEMYLEHLTRQL